MSVRPHALGKFKVVVISGTYLLLRYQLGNEVTAPMAMRAGSRMQIAGMIGRLAEGCLAAVASLLTFLGHIKAHSYYWMVHRGSIRAHLAAAQVQ